MPRRLSRRRDQRTHQKVTQMRHIPYFAALLLSFTLVACGGNGGDIPTLPGGPAAPAAPVVPASGVPASAVPATPTLNLVVGTPMTSYQPVTGAGGTPPYTYSYTGLLPMGLAYSATTGLMTGTPTATYATANMVFAVKDALNVAAASSVTVAVTVSPPWVGTKQLGAPAAIIRQNGSATDSNGNVYVAGDVNAGLDGNTLTGGTDFFLTKYDKVGTKLYTKQLGAPYVGLNKSITIANGVATDAAGNVFVAGHTSHGLDGNVVTGAQDFFLTKYDATGLKVYTKQLGVAAANTVATSVATDVLGNVYVAGYTTGGLDGNVLTGTQDFFLTKFDSTGLKVYTKQLGVAAASTGATAVATDGNGNVYVTGNTSAGLDGNLLTGTQDFFLTKFDAAGTKVYTKQLGVAAATTTARSVATDVLGNVHVAGDTNGALDGNLLVGANDFFVTSYNAVGTKLYTKQLGVAAATTHGNDVAADGAGSIYVIGDTTGGLDGNVLTGAQDYFLTKYDLNGLKLYTKMGVNGSSVGKSVAINTSNEVYVAGQTSTGVDGNVLTGLIDFFLAKFSNAGVKQ